VQRELKLDTSNGKIVGDAEAMQGWGREYEKDGSRTCNGLQRGAPNSNPSPGGFYES